MPDTSKKISQLATITAAGINSSDLFVVTDVSESQSSKITFENVTNAVLSDANIEARALTFVSKLNDINSSIPSLGNGLYATNLYYDQQYRDGAYFLEWANVSNKPFIPADLGDLTNSTNFVSFDQAQVKMRVAGSSENLATDLTMTSDYVDEGTSNLFYSDDRVQTKVTSIFGGLFNEYSDTFDGGRVIDSLDDVPGTFQSVTNLQSSVVRISDTSLAKHFFAGETLRLYGAADTPETISGAPTSVSITVQGQSGFGEGTQSNYKTFSYRLAYFDTKTGSIGAASLVPLTKNVQYTPDVGTTYENPLPHFNTNNFIRFTGLSAGDRQGILVYRSIDSGPFKLRAVLGAKDFSGGIWQDYHLFDYTSWSGKDSTDNTYSTVTHFPLTAPDAQQRGWLDVTIKSIDVRSGYFDITLGDPSTEASDVTLVYTNPSPSGVTVAHNDTSKINESIQSRSISGNKSVQLNGKTYMATHIIVPDNFGMVGTANVTKIKKLAWSGMNGENYDNSLIKAQSSSNAETLSLYGMDLDGNLTNQSLVNDATDNSLNYIVDFGVAPSDILLDRVRIKNVIGGGIYASSPTSLRITTGEIVNSGVSDVNPFSPLFASDGDSTIVTSNKFENFADSVDVSVTREGMIANNIVKACGSGLLVAGSTFLVSNPNVLIGAANEFLSSPDILNTEFDSINIPLAKFADSGDYQSDSFVYQENGQPFSLRKNSINSFDPTIVYRLNLIQQLSDGSTQPYAVDAGPDVEDTQLSAQTGIPFILNKRYRIKTVGTVNWRAIGAKVGMVGEYFVYNGQTVTGSNGVASADDFAGLNNQVPPVITNIGKTDTEKDDGIFQFKITEADNNKSMLYTGVFSPAQLQQRYKERVSQATLGYPTGSQHLGVAWSASYRYFATVGSIDNGAWYVYQSGANTVIGSTGNNTRDDVTLKNNPEYRMTVNNHVNLVVGMEITIDSHTGWLATGMTPQGPIYARITELSTDQSNEELKNVTLKFYNLLGGGDNPDAPDTAGVDAVNNGFLVKGANSTGTINTVDDFVIAQGLIK